MKVLFLFKSENFMAPIGLCTISAVARRGGHEVCFCETNSDNIVKSVENHRPGVVAFSSCSGEAKHYLRMARQIKERFPEVFTIMGGPHATFNPDVVKEDCLDAVCVGEGEGAFTDLLDALSNGRSVEEIPNIRTPDNADRFTLRNLVEDLDTIPHPDFSLLYDNTPMGGYPLKSFITSRGCPYSCTYCSNSALNRLYRGKGKTVRRHSVDYVIDQILHIKSKWPLGHVKFYDDIFVFRVDDWLEEFAAKYRRKVNLPFFILTRADLLTEEAVKLLKEAGCCTISMSIESGNSEVRKDVFDRDMSEEQILHAHRLCDKYGIQTFTNNIIGLPGREAKEDIESIDLSIRARVTWTEFLIFNPMPSTILGDRTHEEGYHDWDFEKMHTSYQFESPLDCFSAKEKNVQKNIGMLGPICVIHPRLRNLVVKHLIHWPYNPAFIFLYYLVKMSVFQKKIYPTDRSFLQSVRIAVDSMRQEWFRHHNRKG